MSIEPFEIFAIRYAHLGGRHPGENFLVADPHEFASDLDYFVWVLRRGDSSFVIDTGFGKEAAARQAARVAAMPVESLRLVGVNPNQVSDVIITHLHYDHAGNLDKFPRARFHLQDRDMAYATGRCMCHENLRAPFDLENMLEIREARLFGSSGISRWGCRTCGRADSAPRGRAFRGIANCAGLDAARMGGNRVRCHTLVREFRTAAAFPIVYSVAEMLEGFKMLYGLADSPEHIVPGHDCGDEILSGGEGGVRRCCGTAGCGTGTSVTGATEFPCESRKMRPPKKRGGRYKGKQEKEPAGRRRYKRTAAATRAGRSWARRGACARIPRFPPRCVLWFPGPNNKRKSTRRWRTLRRAKKCGLRPWPQARLGR